MATAAPTAPQGAHPGPSPLELPFPAPERASVVDRFEEYKERRALGGRRPQSAQATPAGDGATGVAGKGALPDMYEGMIEKLDTAVFGAGLGPQEEGGRSQRRSRSGRDRGRGGGIVLV